MSKREILTWRWGAGAAAGVLLVLTAQYFYGLPRWSAMLLMIPATLYCGLWFEYLFQSSEPKAVTVSVERRNKETGELEEGEMTVQLPPTELRWRLAGFLPLIIAGFVLNHCSQPI